MVGRKFLGPRGVRFVPDRFRFGVATCAATAAYVLGTADVYGKGVLERLKRRPRLRLRPSL
jgi:hypothetical protein